MTQSSISQSGQAPESAQLNFNPLHPSMELPPEQLIRLLGMETKKDRKGQSGSADRSTVDSTINAAPARHDDAPSAPDPRRGRRPLMLALIVAVTATVAALFFAFTTQQDRHASPAAPVVTSSTGNWHHTASRQAAIDIHLMKLQKDAQQRFDQRSAEAIEKTASAGLPDAAE